MLNVRRTCLVVSLSLATTLAAAEASAQSQLNYVVHASACVPVSGGGTTLTGNAQDQWGVIAKPSQGVMTATSLQLSSFGVSNTNQGLQRVWCPLPDPNFTGPGAGSYFSVTATVYNRSTSLMSCNLFATDDTGSIISTETKSVAPTGNGLTPATLVFDPITGDPFTAVVMCDLPAPNQGNFSWLSSISYGYIP